MVRKLVDGEKHFLQLIAKGQAKNGWANVSDVLYPLVKKMPAELVEFNDIQQVRLTARGEAVLDAMVNWL